MFSALALYGSLAMLLAGAAVVGQGVYAACGRRRWSPLSPAVGLATLVFACGLTIRLPGRGVTAAVAACVLVVASLVVLWVRRPDLQGFPAAAFPVVLAIVLAASIPFAVAGAFGALGVSVSNDLGHRMDEAYWLQTHHGIEPPLVSSGYPVGPHAVAIVLSQLTGANFVATFTALLMATAAAAGIASLAVFGGLGPVRRTIAAVLVGLPYLATSYYVQASFKETLMGLFVLAFVLGLRHGVGEERAPPVAEAPVARPRAVEIGVPLGLLLAATIDTYSLPGLAWGVGTLVLWALATLLASPRTIDRLKEPASRRALLRPFAIGLGLLVVITLPNVGRIVDFLHSNNVGLSGGGLGNLVGRIPVREELGVWLAGDFRLSPPSAAHADLLSVVAIVAVVIGVLRLLRLRELSLLAGAVTAALVYLGTRLHWGPYIQAKTLVVASPLIMLVALVGVLAPGGREPERIWPWEPLRRAQAKLGGLVKSGPLRDAVPAARAALAVAFVALAGLSSYVALAGAHVDPGVQAAELAQLRPRIDGRSVLFLGSTEYSPYDLRPSAVFGWGGQPVPRIIKAVQLQGDERFDWDSVGRAALNRVDFVITTRSRFASEPPRNFRPVQSTPSFTLWQRLGPTPPRRQLDEPGLPYTVLAGCSTPAGRQLRHATEEARVFRRGSIVNSPSGRWTLAPSGARPPGRSASATVLVEGETLGRTLRLPAGRWQISVQYQSSHGVEMRAPGWRATLPPNLERLGPMWPAGTIDVAQSGPIPFTAALESPSWLGRILQHPRRFQNGAPAQLGLIAAVRTGRIRQTLPLRQACGRKLDWFTTR